MLRIHITERKMQNSWMDLIKIKVKLILMKYLNDLSNFLINRYGLRHNSLKKKLNNKREINQLTICGINNEE